MERTNYQVRLDPQVSMKLRSLEVAGIKGRDVIAAAVDALTLALAKQGKIGGDFKARLLAMEQAGTLGHQKLIETLEDSDDFIKVKPPAPVVKRPPGRPKKVKAVDPILAELGK